MPRRHTLIALGIAAFAAALLVGCAGSDDSTRAGLGSADPATAVHTGHPGMGGTDAGADSEMGGMDHSGGAGMGGTANTPERPRALVIGGFAAVNALVLLGAIALRRRGAPLSARRRPAGSAAARTT